MLKLDSAALSDVGRRRNHNEDYLGDLIFRKSNNYDPGLLNQRGYLFAVADGMGGHASGEVASEMATTVLFERYYNGASTGDPYQDLSEAVKEANFQVHHAGTSSGRGQMGTTLTLALVMGDRVIVGNVGDSRTYLIRQGLPARITHDHSLVQDQIDMGALTPEQAERSMIRNVITRAMGHREEVEPDFFEEQLQPHDVILLCSDGLHGAVREEELGTIVTSSNSLQEAAQTLIDLANERGGVDNISVMLIAIVELGDPTPPILNDRATFYPPPRPIVTRDQGYLVDPPTDRIPKNNRMQSASEASANTAMLDPSNAPTAPNLPVKPTLEQSTKKFEPNQMAAHVAATKPKRGSAGPLIGGIVVLMIAVGIIAAIMLSGNSTVGPATVAVGTLNNTTTPAVTTTATVTANVSTVPTVTPAPGNTSVATTLPVAATPIRVDLKLADLKNVQIKLQNFSPPVDSYLVVLRSESRSQDVEFKSAGNGLFEPASTLPSAGQYRVVIRSGSAAPEQSFPMNLTETEANSPALGVKLSLNSDKTTLLVEVTKP